MSGHTHTYTHDNYAVRMRTEGFKDFISRDTLFYFVASLFKDLLCTVWQCVHAHNEYNYSY